jgi:hypothetical protein
MPPEHFVASAWLAATSAQDAGDLVLLGMIMICCRGICSLFPASFHNHPCADTNLVRIVVPGNAFRVDSEQKRHLPLSQPTRSPLSFANQ